MHLELICIKFSKLVGLNLLFLNSNSKGMNGFPWIKPNWQTTKFDSIISTPKVVSLGKSVRSSLR